MILFAGLFGCGGAAPPAPTPASVVPLGAWHAAAGACVVPVRTFVDATLAPADATAMVAALAAWAAVDLIDNRDACTFTATVGPSQGKMHL